MPKPLVVYTSSYCMHSRSVVRFLNKHEIPAEIISIDGNSEAREKLMSLNRGYASVPTLIFPDGTQLTEPSSGELRSKLNIEQPTLAERLKSIVGK